MVNENSKQIGILGKHPIVISKEHGLVFEPKKEYVVGVSLYNHLRRDFPHRIVNLTYSEISLSIRLAFSGTDNK
jgi:hypothetical protein